MSRAARVLLVVGFTAVVGCGPKPTPTQDAPVLAPVVPTTPAPRSDATALERAKKNLREIGLAMNLRLDTYHEYVAASTTADCKGVSWRVQILPFMGKEGQELFDKFHPYEPWDSPHNKALIDQMPAVYASPDKPADKGMTHIRSFVGPRAFFQSSPSPGREVLVDADIGGLSPNPNGPKVKSTRGRMLIPDGTSHTLMAVEAAEPVVWTKPDELEYAAGYELKVRSPLPKLGGVFAGGFHGLMGDGQVFWFPETTTEDTLRAAITIDGLEWIDWTPIKSPNVASTSPKPTAVPDSLPDAAVRRTTVGRMQAVWNAWVGYHDANRLFPAGVVLTKESVGLSWRVQLLPYLGHEELYKQFKLTEAWDSEHNKKLLEKMPDVFSSAGKAAEKGHTFLRTTYGPQGVIDKPILPPGEKPLPLSGEPGQPVYGRRQFDFRDGLSNTILFAESATAVPWTKPEGMDLIPAPQVEQETLRSVKMVPPKLGGTFEGGFHAALADGSVVFYKPSLPTDSLSSLLTVEGGEWADPQPAAHVLYAVPPKR